MGARALRLVDARTAGSARLRPAACAWLAACLAAVWGPGGAQAAAGADDSSPGAVPEVVIIGTSPLPGTSIDVGKIPGTVQTLHAADLAREGEASLTRALAGQLSSININESLNDPFQPDILYRGFEASPLLGVSSGLAVYMNGVRVNEPFGDVVNWDLIPDVAVNRIDLVSANPVYGLNALGGALSVTMKNGFTFTGANGEFSFGSFARRFSSAEVGANDGTLGIYAAARWGHQDGWRFFAGDSIHQYYLTLSARGEHGSLDLSYTRANNQMFGQSAAPVQSLALSTEEIFTGPQSYANNVDFVTLNGSYPLSERLSLQGVLYYRNFRQSISNGNKTSYTACTGGPGTGDLCQPDGLTPLVDSAGNALPDISQGGAIAIGENDFESIRTQGKGAALQLADSQSIAGHANQLTAGLSIDSAHIDFYSGTQIGTLSPQLLVLPSSLYVDTPEGTAFPATPVNLGASSTYYGYYLSDAFDVTRQLTVTASGRYNIAQEDLTDRRGSALSGQNRYAHFNPALGFTYAVTPALNAYAGWSINNRAPTPSEIECSDPTQPCLLPADLAGDPPNLKQVVSHSYEVGMRGTSGDLRWNVSVFRTDVENDIYAIATSLSTGFFQNIGWTRREGFEGGVSYQSSSWSAYAQYSYVDATFRSGFTESSTSNPFADANGHIQVEPGDRLPGIPLHRFKAGVDYEVLPHWTVGASVVLVSPQYYKGDESNQNPELPSYHVFGLHSSYRIGSHVELFASIQNLFNARYATFGTYADPTGVGAPGIPPGAQANGPGVDNRFQNPAAPFAVFAGIRAAL
jgi:iron complex outermembrane receptor protein